MTVASHRRVDLASGPRLVRSAGRRIAPATAVLAVLLLFGGLMLLYAGRHLTFFFDEWSFIVGRRGGDLNTYLDPHNGHLVLFPVIVYKILFAIFGLRHYTPYQVVAIALHLLCVGLLYVLVRRRLGPWPALVPAVLLLFMGSAWQDLLWPFQMSYLASVAGGLGALVLLERRDTIGDAGAAALLAWSLASSGIGAPFLAACAAALAVQRGGWHRVWIVVVPAALYGLWYIGWSSGEHVTSDAVLAAPQYVADAGAGTAAGIAGLSSSWGPPLAVALAATMAVAWRRLRGEAVTPMLLGAAVGALTFWILAALTRADSPDPTASRYLYVGAVLIMLAVAEVAGGARLPRVWLVPAAILLLGAVIGNLGTLRDGERGLRAADNAVRSSLAAVEVAAPVVSPAFLPQPTFVPQLTAGQYLAAVHELGSPALSLAELERAPEPTRESADQVLEHAEELVAIPTARQVAGSRPVPATGVHGGQASARGLCEHFTPTVPYATIDTPVQPGTTLSVHDASGASALLYLRRFGAEFSLTPFTAIAGGRSSLVRFPDDRVPQLRWQVRVATSTPVDICVS